MKLFVLLILFSGLLINVSICEKSLAWKICIISCENKLKLFLSGVYKTIAPGKATPEELVSWNRSLLLEKTNSPDWSVFSISNFDRDAIPIV